MNKVTNAIGSAYHFVVWAITSLLLLVVFGTLRLILTGREMFAMAYDKIAKPGNASAAGKDKVSERASDAHTTEVFRDS